MVPVIWVVMFFDFLNQSNSHVSNSAGHNFNILQIKIISNIKPNLVEFGFGKNLFDNSGSVNGGIGVGSSSKSFDDK